MVRAPDPLAVAARPLRGDGRVPDDLVTAVADARYVLIGEASHGTREFYALRAELTRRLIIEHGFTAVAVEADWPDAFRVNRYVRGDGPGRALDGFARFPRWMWRNRVVARFVEDLRTHNDGRRWHQQAGFYGLDLYSLHGSIGAIVDHLERTDPEAAARARLRYACFDHSGVDAQEYGYAVATGRRESCEDEVVAQLADLPSAVGGGDGPGYEDVFATQQNARLVADAERYYRAMFRGREAWNLRDTHMADVLDALVEHLGSGGVAEPRVVVWAHNSHLGDARATEMGWARGELNLGQLVRERHGDAAVNVGLTTCTGEVTAASAWDGPVHRRRVRPALPGSWEDLLHGLGHERLWVDLRGDEVAAALRVPRLERAIGVIYRPETERVSHYFEALLADQFDLVLHVDVTHALEPLDMTTGWQEAAEPPQTYPWAV